MNFIFKSILNILLPPRCLKCGKLVLAEEGLCAKCLNELNFIAAPYCRKCGQAFLEEDTGQKMLCGGCLKRKRSPFRMLRSSLEYDEASKPLILALKFMDKTENATTLAKWLNLSMKDLKSEGADLIIPVPLHFSRMLKRRYNQSALLVKELSKISKIKADYTSLYRKKKTRPQVELMGLARVKNVKGAFSVKKPQNIKGKRIILVDDVMTTGSTLKECAIALKKAGAKSIDALTIARVS